MASGAPERVERRLAAIVAADVAGYSRLMGADEEGTLGALKSHRRELVDLKIAEHRGRIVKTTGDGMLVEFASVVDAVRSSLDIQRGMAERNRDVAADKRIEFRVGINLGDIISDGDDIHGDGVNVAARLEALAEPGGICAAANVWDQVRDKLDLAVEDMGEHAVKNIARPIHAYRVLTAPAAARPTLALPDKPSLAVLPFTNMSGDPEQEYFADGVVEDIITGLARLKWLFVIARNSSFAYKGKSPDIRQVGRELGVRYVLEGGVRKAANRVRITGQLIDATTGTHIWADRFDGGLEDIFDLQDRITSSVVGAIEPALRTAEMHRAEAKPTESLDAYDCFLRALAQWDSMTRAGWEEAVTLCRKAIAIDPRYASAYGLASSVLTFRITQGWASTVDSDRHDAAAFARKAIDLGADDPTALWMAGQALVHAVRDFDRGLAAIDRSLLLNPNSGQAWNISGWVRWNCGDGSTAIDHLQRAMRLSPLDPWAHGFEGGIGWAHFVEGRYDEAIKWSDLALRDQPKFTTSLRCKVAALGLLGRTEEAAEALRTLLTLQPNATIPTLRAIMPLRRAEHMATYLDGLRRAGVPE